MRRHRQVEGKAEAFFFEFTTGCGLITNKSDSRALRLWPACELRFCVCWYFGFAHLDLGLVQHCSISMLCDLVFLKAQFCLKSDQVLHIMAWP